MKHIFWGSIFIFFHFRMNGFDLLPDFLGYLFISYGLYTLSEKSEQFKRALCCSIGLLLMNLILLLTLFGLRFNLLFYLIFDCLSIILYLMLFYFMAKGMKDLQAQQLLKMNASIFMKIWFVQALSHSLGYFFTLIPSELAYLISALVTMIGFGANISFLIAFYNARKSVSSL